MIFSKSSIVWRLTAFIMGGTGFVLLAVLAYNHVTQRDLLIEMNETRSDALTLAAVNQIETQVGRAETAVHGAAMAWAMDLDDRASVINLIENTLRTQPHLFGLAVALPADSPQGGYAVLYGFRDNGAVRVEDDMEPVAARQEDWFYLPSQLRHPVWTEPYYDEVAHTTMVSYSVPIVRDGRVLAVVTGDVSLAGLRELLDNLMKGKQGEAIVTSSHGVFISHPDPELETRESIFSIAEQCASDEQKRDLYELGWEMLRQESGRRLYQRPGDDSMQYISYRIVPSVGWSVGVVVPEDAVLATLRDQSRANVQVGVGSLMLLLVAAIAAAQSMAIPLRRLDTAARELASGHFDTPLPPVRRRDEIGRLTESFAKMRTELRTYIDELTATTAAKEKIASELLIAHQIQLGIVPKLFPPFPHRRDMDLFAYLEPAREVGGDLYDFALLDDDHLYVAIGDVSGKGVPASLLMAVGKTLLKASVQAVRDPARALALVNEELAADNDSCMFITAFCGVLNLLTGDLTFANAGHNPPLLVRTGGTVEMLSTRPGAPLAVIPGARYASHGTRLDPGDLLMLYTDGVTEAMNPQSELFDDARLIEVAQRDGAKTARGLIEALLAAVKTHAAGAEQSDDITLLTLRVATYPNAHLARNEREPDARLALKNQAGELPQLVDWLETLGARHNWSDGVVMNLNLALEEWFANVVNHAYTDADEHTVQFRLWIEARTLRIEIEDDGRPFDPTAQAAVDTTAGLEQRQIGGLGIHFIRRITSSMTYRREADHNLLTLTACLDPAD